MQDRRPGGFAALKGLVEELGIDSPSSQRAILHCGLAEVALQEGRLSEGFAAVEAGLAAIESGFARVGHPELLRIRAGLRSASGEDPRAVRDDLEAALAIATEQGAQSDVARVSADLASLPGAARPARPVVLRQHHRRP